MTLVKFRRLPRAAAIDTFERWADRVEAKAAGFGDAWSAAHPTSGALPEFEEALRWASDQVDWLTSTPADAELPEWLLPGDDVEYLRGRLQGTPCHLDPASARLLDQFCAMVVTRLREEEPRARLFMDEADHQWRHHWAVGDSLTHRYALRPVEVVLANRYRDLDAHRSDPRDFITMAAEHNARFLTDFAATSGGLYGEGVRATQRDRLRRGDLFIIDRADTDKLIITLDSLLANRPADVEDFVEALGAARGHAHAARQPDGRILLTGPKQTRTRLNAWAIKWWRPRLPDEPRPRIPDASLEPLSDGQWAIYLDDTIANRASGKVDQLVALLAATGGITEVARIDREVIELTTTLAPHDLAAAVTTAWSDVFSDARYLLLPRDLS